MQKLVRFWEEQTWLDKPSRQVAALLSKTMSGRAGKRIANFLNGVWLGHPLHPVLTDLPAGAWTMAGILDIACLRKRRSTAAATAAVGIGVLGAIPAALAGLADGQHLSGQNRRVGAGHAILNTGALVFYLVSLWSRLRGNSGRWSGFMGLGFFMASAYLGGDMISRRKIGVDHRSDAELPSRPIEIGSENDLPEGQLRRMEVDGFPVLVYRARGRVYAVADVCPHLGCSLSEGAVQDEAVTCPCHGSTFSLLDGHVIEGPAAFPVAVLATQLVEGRVLVGSAPSDGSQG